VNRTLLLILGVLVLIGVWRGSYNYGYADGVHAARLQLSPVCQDALERRRGAEMSLAAPRERAPTEARRLLQQAEADIRRLCPPNTLP
jgi:hypothetical protein